MNNTRALVVTLALTLLGCCMCTSAFGQRNPTMAGQRTDAERENLYTQFAENKKFPIPDRQRIAYYAAKDYLKRFDDGRDEHVAEMRKFVNEYEKVLKNFNVFSYYADKKYLKAFEAGRTV